MLTRIFYTLRKAKQNFHALQQCNNPEPKTVLNLPLNKFKSEGIIALVFDFDGVLANYGEEKPLEETIPVLQQSCELFKVYILTNKPNMERKKYFADHFPKITFISGTKKKPYPDGLYKIIQDAICLPENLLLVDDRLLTGALAACIAGTKFYFINKPYRDFKKRFIHECFFQILRFAEVLVLNKYL